MSFTTGSPGRRTQPRRPANVAWEAPERACRTVRQARTCSWRVVQSIKRNLKVDWTQPHRDDVRAQIGIAVRNVLRRRGVSAPDLEQMTSEVMVEAQALYADWPLAA